MPRFDAGPYREELFLEHGDGDTIAEDRPLGLVVDKTMRVYIRNIAPAALEEHGADAMRKEFAAYGPLDRFNLFVDAAGRFTGCGMATYQEASDAKAAIKALNKQVHKDGSILSVEIAASHGAVPVEQLERATRRRKMDTERWGHDLFDELQKPRPHGRGRGSGRGFGGRGTSGGRDSRGRGGSGGRRHGGSGRRETETSLKDLDAEMDSYRRLQNVAEAKDRGQ